MARLRRGTVGILPAGALGVSFAYHLTERFTRLDGRVAFLERAGSASGRALRESQAPLQPVADMRTHHAYSCEIRRTYHVR